MRINFEHIMISDNSSPVETRPIKIKLKKLNKIKIKIAFFFYYLSFFFTIKI